MMAYCVFAISCRAPWCFYTRIMGIKMAEWEYQRGDICFQLPEKGNYVLVITHLACNIVVKQILYGVYL